jgi:hypothetical protein
MRLPTQKELPEYYDMIKHPVDFNKIKKKLGEYRYRNLDELEADVMLLCKNAQEFNMENSNVIFRMKSKSHQYFLFRSMKIQLFFNQYLPMHVNVLKKVKFQSVRILKMNQMMTVKKTKRILLNNYLLNLFLEPLKKRVKKEGSTKKVRIKI